MHFCSVLIVAQADVIVALGTRLGLQQTGFNWQDYAPCARVVQVDIDPAELDKGHPVVEVPLCADANATLDVLSTMRFGKYPDWIAFCEMVMDRLPID